ncbi:DUF6300 family protein [Streptomyces sp. KR55]|uniref:DUF6300 family protein n=1 Tax=Streptomyces sp. KR55 TaxID=3457425 RepID=UPI003FD66385
MHRDMFQLSSDHPPCGRCLADDVIVTGNMPVTGAFGQPIVIQLCPHCDADAPAGGALVRFFREGGGKEDPPRTEEAARLMFAWMREAMAVHGYGWMPTPGGGPSLS